MKDHISPFWGTFSLKTIGEATFYGKSGRLALVQIIVTRKVTFTVFQLPLNLGRNGYPKMAGNSVERLDNDALQQKLTSVKRWQVNNKI